MLKNYFKTSLRFLIRNKSFSLINIAGLAIGTLCCLYIVLYVLDQYSYDQHHQDVADIYRVTSRLKFSGASHQIGTASPPIVPAMKRDFGEIKEFTRVMPLLGVKEHLLHYKDRSLYEKSVVLVDSTFFNIFTYHFVNGNAANAFRTRNTIVLERDIAANLFGQEDPVGKVITLDNNWGKTSLTVSGVIDYSLGKSHIDAKALIALNGYSEEMRLNDVWSGNNYAMSYIKVLPQTNVTALERKFPAFLDKYAGNELKTRGMEKELHLQPITAIHTSPGYDAADRTVSSSFLHMLLLIAGMIQLIACINFMNLSSAKAARRAREVGVRKVIGANRGSLILQFLSESFLLSLLSVLIAIPALAVAMPVLNGITHADIHMSALQDMRVWGIMAGSVLVTGFVAGSYPAFYLSAFQAIHVMKGNFSNNISASGIRRSLVVFQFVISIVLITGITVIYSQLQYIKNKDLGFDQSQQLIFSFHTNDMQEHIPGFMNDLRQLAEVNVVTKADNYMGSGRYHDWGVYLPGSSLSEAVDQENITSDENFVKTMGIRMVSGRDFRQFDSSRVLINETLAKRLGLDPTTAPGTHLLTGDSGVVLEVAGVMKDFNYESLHTALSPFMLIYAPADRDINTVVASTRSRDYETLIKKVGAIWQRNFAGAPFMYQFMDDQVQKQYETEITLSHIINSFTLVAIFISCLGLFGLVAFSAEQRRKEISIRKVLGASVTGIVRLLSADFLKLVCIAFLIATPLAGYIMHEWLQGFVYRVDISWWMFAIAGGLAVCIALLTVSIEALKAAVAAPVKSLRSE